jgi:hypothetical protein
MPSASPEAWPHALKALTEAAGVAGAALIIFNKCTGNVDEAHFSGLSAGVKSDYVRHYAAVDPYSPLVDGDWKKLSECLPQTLLRHSEWHNDFVLTCGISDALGGAACRYDDPSRYLRYSSTDRSPFLRQGRFDRRPRDHPIKARSLASY